MSLVFWSFWGASACEAYVMWPKQIYWFNEQTRILPGLWCNPFVDGTTRCVYYSKLWNSHLLHRLQLYSTGKYQSFWTRDEAVFCFFILVLLSIGFIFLFQVSTCMVSSGVKHPWSPSFQGIRFDSRTGKSFCALVRHGISPKKRATPFKKLWDLFAIKRRRRLQHVRGMVEGSGSSVGNCTE